MCMHLESAFLLLNSLLEYKTVSKLAPASVIRKTGRARSSKWGTSNLMHNLPRWTNRILTCPKMLLIDFDIASSLIYAASASVCQPTNQPTIFIKVVLFRLAYTIWPAVLCVFFLASKQGPPIRLFFIHELWISSPPSHDQLVSRVFFFFVVLSLERVWHMNPKWERIRFMLD